LLLLPSLPPDYEFFASSEVYFCRSKNQLFSDGTRDLGDFYLGARSLSDVWRNTQLSYGLVAITIHWTMALVIVGLFGLGLWMVELTYYDPWYRQAPNIHKGVGVLLSIALIFRLAWRLLNPPPPPVAELTAFERTASAVVHAVLYLLLLAVVLSGYLISTADGRGIDVFGLFRVPATVTGLPEQADLAGRIHLILAVTLIALAGVHALAALKHHFVDRDRTLRRMLGRSP
jgi:cytochrome b561